MDWLREHAPVHKPVEHRGHASHQRRANRALHPVLHPPLPHVLCAPPACALKQIKKAKSVIDYAMVDQAVIPLPRSTSRDTSSPWFEDLGS